MASAEQLRQQAHRCLDLAADTHDQRLALKLLHLAMDLSAQVDLAEEAKRRQLEFWSDFGEAGT